MIKSVSFLIRLNQIRQILLNRVNKFLDTSFIDLYPDIHPASDLNDNQKTVKCSDDFFQILNLVCDIVLHADLDGYDQALLRAFLRDLDNVRHELLSELIQETEFICIVNNVNLWNCSLSELRESVITILYDIADLLFTALRI